MNEAGRTDSTAARFRRFAERECAGISPLYEALARATADDVKLLGLAASARPGQPLPNMLFAAVQALLHRQRGHPLAAFYASLTDETAPADQAFPTFRAFCLENQDAIADILRQRVVSTNEVQRAACLMPAFARAARKAGGPLSLIEVGSSAGLLLLWNRFAYDYGRFGRLGDATAPLTLMCEVRGSALPPLPQQLPRVTARLGIDPHPLDPADPSDADWLRALIWPERRERLERLDAALTIAANVKPKVLAGTAQECLSKAVAMLPSNSVLAVFHAFTLNQFSAEQRQAFLADLDGLGRERPVFRVGLEWEEAPSPVLTLTGHARKPANPTLLARCDAHGRWIAWNAR